MEHVESLTSTETAISGAPIWDSVARPQVCCVRQLSVAHPGRAPQNHVAVDTTEEFCGASLNRAPQFFFDAPQKDFPEIHIFLYKYRYITGNTGILQEI